MPHLNQVLSRYFKAGAPRGVVAAYLFGSHARGEPHRESDVDIGVLVDRTQYPSRAARAELRVQLIAELIHVLGMNVVDVVILNDAPPELGAHVVTRGQRIHAADPELEHAFVRDIQLRAADLRPFLDRMRRIKRESLRR